MRLLLWLAVGLASEPMLAPTLQDLDASMLRVARLMERAAEHEDDLAAAQALWVDDRCSEQQCTAARVADLVRQQREAGSRLRQDVQGARAELVRADRMVVFPPLHPALFRRTMHAAAGQSATGFGRPSGGAQSAHRKHCESTGRAKALDSRVVCGRVLCTEKTSSSHDQQCEQLEWNPGRGVLKRANF